MPPISSIEDYVNSLYNTVASLLTQRNGQPQRPVRSLKISDENAIPTLPGQKALHSRNKSSPALSSLAKAGALKATTKRTAFGDVSNTINGVRPKDDSALNAGSLKDGVEKPLLLNGRNQPSTTFLKPAQRPAKLVSHKSVADISISDRQIPARIPLADTRHIQQPIVQPVPARKTLKRAPSIYQDAQALSEIEPDSKVQKPESSIRELPAIPQETKRQAQVSQGSKLNISFQGTKSRDEELKNTTHAATIDLGSTSSAATIDDSAALRSDGIYLDDNGDVQWYPFTNELEVVSEEVVSSQPRPLQQSRYPTSLPSHSYEQLALEQAESEFLKHEVMPTSEYPEYWEEDEEEYEDGYVTARSFKARGENTTIGATTVLFPKATQKSTKEIAAAKAVIEANKTPDEIDDEAWDTTMVAEYGDEIFQYMRDLEVKMLPNVHYMDNQTEIQWSMRSVLMDWLVQVHHRFGLLPETLFLCCNYIDRFLSAKVVSLAKLQLVGATAIFVAAKYEEINCPSINEIVYMVDNGFSVDEILKAERFMLNMLKFELGWPGPMSFLRRISKADDYDLETRTLAKYFLEVTIMDERFVGSPPSFTAAGAHCLARMMLRKGNWSQGHVYYSDYTYSQLYSLVLLIVECCENPQKHHAAIYDKYMDKRYKRASIYVENEMARGFQIPDSVTEKSTSYALGYIGPATSIY